VYCLARVYTHRFIIALLQLMQGQMRGAERLDERAGSRLSRSCQWCHHLLQDGPFIFTSFASEKKEEDSSTAGPVEWLCGETASVEVEISNPTDVHIKVRKLCTYVISSEMATFQASSAPHTFIDCHHLAGHV